MNYLKNYLKIIFILSSLFFLSSSLATTYNSVHPNIPKKIISSQKSVWHILDTYTTGTGFFISPNQFVTNFHIIESLLKYSDLDLIVITQHDTHQVLKVKSIQKLSALHDLAVLEIDGEVTNYLTLKSSTPKPREDLFLVGYPQGSFKILRKTGNAIFTDSQTYRFFINYYRSLNGASGSPVLDQEGKVVGVISSSNYKGLVSTIKVNHLQNILNKKTKSFSNSYEDIKKELKNLHEMAKQGDSYAQYQLSTILGSEVETKNDMATSLYWLEKAARQGLVKAQFRLSQMYYESPRNNEKTFYWMQKAARQGYGEAQLELAKLYYLEIGVSGDDKMILFWLKKAAENSIAEAQSLLGQVYFLGKITPKDDEKAFYWFQKSARQGISNAQYFTGNMHYLGLGTPKDDEKALYWFQKSARQGYASSQLSLARHYLKLETPEGDEKAFYWMQKAARQGLVEAQDALEELNLKKTTKIAQ